jgi:tetratricopeptide (TPR) repeat protein
MNLSLKQWFWPCLTALGLVALELPHCAPGIVAGDAPELATAAYLLGPAHSPGYPLYVLLGKLFMFLPLGTPAFRMTFLSISILVVAFLFMVLLLDKIKRVHGSNQLEEEGINNLVSILFSSLVVFLCPMMLRQSLSPEVFALHTLFTVLILYFVFDATEKTWTIACFMVGLSIGHQHLTILLIPAFLWAYREVCREKRQWAFGLTFALVGLSVYLFLPLRAALQPLANWGNPNNIDRFMIDFERLQYGGDFPPGKILNALFDLWLYLELFALSGWGMVAILAGVGWWSARRQWPIAYGVGLLVSFLLPPILLRTPPNLENNSTITPFLGPFFVWCGPGLLMGMEWLKEKLRRKEIYWFLTAGMVLACFILWPSTRLDQSRNFSVENTGRDNLLVLPAKGVFYSQGDGITFPLAYLKLVGGLRPDVDIFDLMGGVLKNFPRDAYNMPKAFQEEKWEKDNHPTGIFYSEKPEEGSRTLVTAGLLFEVFNPADPGRDENFWQWAKPPGVDEGQDYLSRETGARYYLFRLNRDPNPESAYLDLERVKPLATDNPRVLVNLGIWEKDHGQIETAAGTLKQALKNDPENALAWFDLGDIHTVLGNRPEALKDNEEATRLDPDNYKYHSHLAYLLYQSNRLDEAKFHWEETIHLNPMFPDPYRNLGFCTMQSNPSYAQQMFLHYLSLVPDPPDKGVILDFLRKMDKTSPNGHS